MGLDNGITIRFREGKEPKWSKRLRVLDDSPCVLDDGPKDGFGKEFELAYWRKCWNVRKAVLDELAKMGRHGDDYEYCLSADELRRMCKAIGKVLNRKDWDRSHRYGYTIWEWDESGSDMKRQNRRCLKAAERLSGMDPGDYSIRFYDSY